MKSTSNVLTGLLRLVEAGQGQIDTRIRIQKEAFILAALGYPHLPVNSFTYHHYGPFSRELSDTLQVAVSSGLLQESQAPGADGGFKYIYHLTDSGKTYLSEAGGEIGELKSVVDRLGREHWRALELAATSLFLSLRGNVPQDEAISKALELKPSTKPFFNEAKSLLSEFRVSPQR